MQTAHCSRRPMSVGCRNRPSSAGERVWRASATGQVAEPPEEPAYDEGVTEMVKEHLQLGRELDEVMEHNEAARDAYANETRTGPQIQVGNLVFLRKGHVERAATAVSPGLSNS